MRRKELKGGLKNADNVTRICINIIEFDKGSGVSLSTEGFPKGGAAIVWFALLSKVLPKQIAKVGRMITGTPEEATRIASEFLESGKTMQDILEGET